MHIFSFDWSSEILLCHSSISSETSTSVTLTCVLTNLKLIRMLKYRNNTYNNSYWQQQTLEKKIRKNESAEEMAEFCSSVEKDHVW